MKRLTLEEQRQIAVEMFSGFATALSAGLRAAVDAEQDPGRREFNRRVAKVVSGAPIEGESKKVDE